MTVNALEVKDLVKVYDRGVNLSGNPEEIYRALVSYRLGDMWAPNLSTVEPILVETEHFAACIRDAAAPVTDGQLGLRVVELLEAATQSMARRGAPVEFAPARMAV